MENPLVILLLFVFLVTTIICLVHLVFSLWRASFPSRLAKMVLTALSAMLLFGGAWLFNRSNGTVQNLLIFFAAMIISGKLTQTGINHWHARGKTGPGILGVLIMLVILAGLLFWLLAMASRILNRFDMM